MSEYQIKLKRQINKVALWVKEYSHALRVLGGVFFVFALISGLFWIGGLEIEPVAFVLGLISSLLLASPSIAEYIQPNRKPVREMTFDEILEFIQTTDPKSDWYGISREWASERFLKEDPRLRFRAKFDEDGIQCEDFREDWANCHPDSRATGYWFDLYYDGAFIDRIILVAVDGARAMMPLPNLNTKKIKKYNYIVAQIHDSIGSLDEYIQRSGLEVEHS